MADIRSMFMKMGSKPKDKEKAGEDDGAADKKVQGYIAHKKQRPPRTLQ